MKKEKIKRYGRNRRIICTSVSLVSFSNRGTRAKKKNMNRDKNERNM